MRFLIVILVIAALYVAADRGMFNSFRTSNTPGPENVRTSDPGDGPAERLGAAIDRGIADAGRAVQSAGKQLEKAANGSPRTPPAEN